MERRNEVEKSKWRERGRKGGKKKSWGKTGEISRMPRPAAPAEGISLSTLDHDIYIYLH